MVNPMQLNCMSNSNDLSLLTNHNHSTLNSRFYSFTCSITRIRLDLEALCEICTQMDVQKLAIW
jgi:hypothetical protein